MDHITWGPVHACPKCSSLVVYQFDDRRRFPRLFEGAGSTRHSCPNVTTPPSIEYFECLCGEQIEIIGGIRYQPQSDNLHVCKIIPASSLKGSVAHRPPIVDLPRLHRIPRGAIIL